MGDSVCADITIIQDIFVETKETFEVMLLPNPNDLLGAIIQPGKDRAIVTISDGQFDRSMCISASIFDHTQYLQTTHIGSITIQVPYMDYLLFLQVWT